MKKLTPTRNSNSYEQEDISTPYLHSRGIGARSSRQQVTAETQIERVCIGRKRLPVGNGTITKGIDAIFWEVCGTKPSAKNFWSFRDHFSNKIDGNEKTYSFRVEMSDISGLDLQLQGLSEGTTAKPLCGKFTVETIKYVEVTLERSTYRSRLLTTYVPLKELGALQDLIEFVIAYKKSKRMALKRGLPSWAQWLPNYSPFWRQIIQSGIFVWTILSILWAFWQLHQHFALFRHILTYFREKLHQLLSPLLEVIYDTIEFVADVIASLLNDYLDPIQVVFLSVWGPFVPLLREAYTVARATVRLFKSPASSLASSIYDGLTLLLKMFMVPVVNMMNIFSRTAGHAVKAMLTPFMEFANPALGSIYKLTVDAHQSARAALTSMWTISYQLWHLCCTLALAILTPFSLLLRAVFAAAQSLGSIFYQILKGFSRFEFDAKKEYVMKILRIAQDNTKTLAVGMTRLTTALPDVKVELRSNVALMKGGLEGKLQDHGQKPVATIEPLPIPSERSVEVTQSYRRDVPLDESCNSRVTEAEDSALDQFDVSQSESKLRQRFPQGPEKQHSIELLRRYGD